MLKKNTKNSFVSFNTTLMISSDRDETLTRHSHPFLRSRSRLPKNVSISSTSKRSLASLKNATEDPSAYYEDTQGHPPPYQMVVGITLFSFTVNHHLLELRTHNILSLKMMASQICSTMQT